MLKTVEKLKSQREEHQYRQFFSENGITSEDLAIYLGVSARTVQNWLRGVYQPNDEVQSKLDDLKNQIEAELAEQNQT